MQDDTTPGWRGGGDALGTLVGRIRIVGRLGEGGFGTVYEGFDEELGRRVALKAIQVDRLFGDARARLQREARILSRLEDQKICRIYDYVHGPERDYLVLERVEGQTLAEVLRDEPARLTHRLRLRIAEQLLDVLVRTHAAGVVHRDLKPANVMLTADDAIKVLDFGIALVDERESGEQPLAGYADPAAVADPTRTLLETHQGRVLGTAPYMSPEQARGHRATPASDVYALGLLLQELFTGVRPHPHGLGVERLLERAAAGETEPVAGVDADLARLINRMKSVAAEKRPTAAEARHALRRIVDKPRRRLRWAAAAAAVLLVVTAGIAHTLRLQRERNAAVAARERAEQARRESEAARREADRSREEAQEVVDFLTGLFAVADPDTAQGRTITADELLRQGAAKIETELSGQPVVRARLMRTIGNVYRELGLYEDADRFLRQALELHRAELGGKHPQVAYSLRSLGILEFIRGRFDAAEANLREALAIEEAGGGQAADLATTLLDLGEVLRRRGDFAQAETVFARSIGIYEGLPDQREGLSKALNNLAGVYWRQKKLDQAEPLMQRVLEIDEDTIGADHPRLARTLNNLGLLAQQRRDFAEAERLFHRALAIKQKAYGAEHPELASTLFNVGETRWRQGDLDGALRWFGKALVLDEKGGGPDHPNVAFTLTGMGNVYGDQGRWAEGEASLRRALAIFDKAAPDHPARQDVVDALAELRRKRSAPAAAAPAKPAAVATTAAQSPG